VGVSPILPAGSIGEEKFAYKTLCEMGLKFTVKISKKDSAFCRMSYIVKETLCITIYKQIDGAIIDEIKMAAGILKFCIRRNLMPGINICCFHWKQLDSC
jgi:hypothetical protein